MKAFAITGLMLAALAAPGLSAGQPPTVFPPTSPLDRGLDWRGGADVQPRPAVVTNPAWVRRPTEADLMAATPDAARKSGTDGSATVECIVMDDGGLNACHVVTEFPLGEGFGEAALRVAPIYRMRSTLPDGVRLGGAAVRVPIRFLIQP